MSRPRVRTDVTVEEANAVLQRHRERAYVAKREAARQHVGKFFRCRISHGHGPKWWLYAYVTHVDSMGWPKGQTFQRIPIGAIEIDVEASIHVQSGGWQPTTRAEFVRNAAKIAVRARDLLSLGADVVPAKPRRAAVRRGK